MKLRIKDRVEGRFMKKLLLTCILVIIIIFIAGCIGEEKTDAGTPASSQISQESDARTTDSVLKPSDFPGLTLDLTHVFWAVPKNTVYVYGNVTSRESYEDTLPIGYRNVGGSSGWKDQAGRIVSVELARYDSVPSALIEYYDNDNAADYYEKNLGEGMLSSDYDYDWGDPHIGDHSFYLILTDPNTDIQITNIFFVHNTNYVIVYVTDEEGKSKKEAIRIAKIIKSRLD